MFHSSHIHVPRNRQPGALRTFVTSSSFGPPDGKEPLRRAILFSTVAMVLLLIGSVLTWLGFNDVFGGRVSMTGPLLIALALLLLLLSMRQFMIARKHNNHNTNNNQLGSVAPTTLTTVVVDRNDGVGAVTVIMDSVNIDHSPQSRIFTDDYAPPSYNEVTRWQNVSAGGGLMCPTMTQNPDDPPPPYEDAVQVHDSVSVQHPSLPFNEDPASLPGYQEHDTSPVGGQMFSVEPVSPIDAFSSGAHSSNVVVMARPNVPSCMTSRPRPGVCQSLSPSAGIDPPPTIGNSVLPPVSSHHWSATGQFFLIPQMLGVVSSSQKQHREGEVPPAYQVVDTPGMSPISYSQAMGVSPTPDTTRETGSKDQVSGCTQPGGVRGVECDGKPQQCHSGEHSQNKPVDCPVSDIQSQPVETGSNRCHIQQTDLVPNTQPNPDTMPETSSAAIIDELENV